MSQALELVPSLTIVDGQPVVSSLKIAEHFDRQHKNVVQSIEKLLKECPSEFGRLNFQPTSYTDSFNRQQPYYNLTRDGFVLLVMGFSGKQALEWKILYIESFAALEKTVQQNTQREALRAGFNLHKKLGPKERKILKKALRYREMGLSYKEIAKLLDVNARRVWHLVKAGQTLGLEAL